MAVSYYYPSPAINVGKGFLGEYLTAFIGQRKEDHKNMIARKLKALDPSKLIDLENQTLKNIGRLEEQIARITREGYAAQARYSIAKIKADGAARVQIIAAQSRMREKDQDLVGKIYQIIYDKYESTIKNDEPTSSDIRQLEQGIPAGPGATGGEYIPNIQAAHAGAGFNEKKKEWLVIKALQIARSKGHTTAYNEIVREYIDDYPTSLGASDPWLAFLGKHRELDPRTLAEKILADHRAPSGVRSIIKNEIEGDREKLGGMPAPPTAGIEMLRGYLSQERTELADVRTQRKEMQKEYRKTAISSYMTPWFEPSYTKAPKWEADFERLGVIGAQDRTAFDHFMSQAYDPMNQNWFGDPVPERIERAQHEEAMFQGYGGGTSPLTPAFTSPGTAEGVDELRQMVDEYKQLVRRDRRGSKSSSAKMYEIYQRVKGSEAAPTGVKDQITRLQGLAVGANPEEKERLEKIIAQLSVQLDLPKYRYGETGAAIEGIIHSASQTGDWSSVHNDVLGAMEQGQRSLEHASEVEYQEVVPALEQAIESEMGAPTTDWPYREVNREDIANLQKMNSSQLNEWYAGQQSLYRQLGDTAPETLAKRRLAGLMKYVYNPDDTDDLLRMKRAEEEIAELKASGAGVPELTARQKAKIAHIVSEEERLRLRQNALKVSSDAYPDRPATPPQPHDYNYREYESIVGKLAKLAGEKARVQGIGSEAFKAEQAKNTQIELLQEKLEGMRTRHPIPSEDKTGPYTTGRWTFTPKGKKGFEINLEPEEVARLNEIARAITLVPGAPLELEGLYGQRRDAQAVLDSRTGSVTSTQLDAARATLAKVDPQIKATVARLAEKNARIKELQTEHDNIVGYAKTRGVPPAQTREEEAEQLTREAGEDVPGYQPPPIPPAVVVPPVVEP